MSRDNAIVIAREWRARDPLFLDTETTGLEGQVCEIAIVDLSGKVLLDTLVKPRWEMEDEARWVHGITDEMLSDAPMFETVWPQVREIIHGRLILIYNAAFDQKRLCASARDEQGETIMPLWDEVYKTLLPGLRWKAEDIGCVMELFAEFYGDYRWDGSARWQKLQTAARYFSLERQNHRALGDAQLCRGVLIGMANSEASASAALSVGEKK